MLDRSTVRYRNIISIIHQIRKFHIIQLVLEIIFVILCYFWLIANINFENGGDPGPATVFTNLYIAIILLILYIQIELGYKYEDLRLLDIDDFPESFLTFHLISVFCSLGIKLIPILVIIPSWIFYHAWVLKPVMGVIIIFSIFLPLPYLSLRKFLENSFEENYGKKSLPSKSLSIFLIIYSIFRLLNFFIMYQIIFGSLSMSDYNYSIYYYIQIGLIIFVLIMQISMVFFLSRLKLISSSPIKN